jgi:hypothetical protein
MLAVTAAGLTVWLGRLGLHRLEDGWRSFGQFLVKIAAGYVAVGHIAGWL